MNVCPRLCWLPGMSQSIHPRFVVSFDDIIPPQHLKEVKDGMQAQYECYGLGPKVFSISLELPEPGKVYKANRDLIPETTVTVQLRYFPFRDGCETLPIPTGSLAKVGALPLQRRASFQVEEKDPQNRPLVSQSPFFTVQSCANCVQDVVCASPRVLGRRRRPRRFSDGDEAPRP